MDKKKIKAPSFIQAFSDIAGGSCNINAERHFIRRIYSDRIAIFNHYRILFCDILRLQMG